MDRLIFTDRFMNCLPLKVNALQSFGTSDCSPGNTLQMISVFSEQVEETLQVKHLTEKKKQ
jgi:hypothetical protein